MPGKGNKSSSEGGPDLAERDPQEINQHVKVHFEEVLGEPDGVRSIDGVWKVSYICFNGTLNCCYKFLSVLCGVPAACCWGFEFACLSCSEIWCVTPMIRFMTIWLYNVRRLHVLILESCCGPFCEVCGLVFSRIAVKNT